MSEQRSKPLPCYDPEGRMLGVRSAEAAQRLIERGVAVPVYGRKGHPRAIFLREPHGAYPVSARPPSGTRYSFLEHLDGGHLCWRLRKLGRGNELRPIFLAVLLDRLRPAGAYA